jgi:hypothetical protein
LIMKLFSVMLCFDNNTYVKLHDDAYDYI